MTTKNFNKMTTKKLTALLETVNGEDRTAIEEILAAREQAKVETTEEETQDLTPEEEAAIKAAEENGGINPLYTGRTVEKKAKITDEERSALAEELKKNVYHRCQAVPFNTVEWVDGYIAGVIEEKRTNKVLYAIKTDDGRRIVKVHDSNLIKILDEVVTPARKVRVGKVKKERAERIDWTPEMIAEEVNNVIGNVGKTVEYEKYRTINENGEEHIEMVSGRILAIVPDKRAQRLLYRISVPTPVEGNPLAVKIVHRVATAEIKIAEEFDAEGLEINTKYCNRREASATRTPLTPYDRYIHCEENVKKAEEKLKKATEELEAKKQLLAKAKAELDAHLDKAKAELDAHQDMQAGTPDADPLA